MTITKKQFSRDLKKALAGFMVAAFLLNTVLPVYAQSAFVLPVPGEMVHLSSAFTPPILKAVKVNPDNPFSFNFIVDTGNSTLQGEELKKESNKLIRYFLASLTTPEDDLWVNLSPYEKDRVVPNSFGVTEMGRDLLAQDYLLKQITATLMYPEEELGKKFWDTVYQKAYEKFGTTNIMANTFNKVWIVPEKAVVYENGMTAFVSDTKLKVMLEEDYKNMSAAKGENATPAGHDTNNIGSQVVRDIIIPELEKEVNEGKNFASLRQVYNSLILANWYKLRLKDSILNKIYIDRNKVAGVDIDDKEEAKKIYEKYIEAFKKGVYNYVKEDTDPVTKEPMPRKYFSGGMNMKLQFNASGSTVIRQGLPPEARRASSGLIEIEAKFDLSNKGQQSPAFQTGATPASSSVTLGRLKKGLAALALGTIVALTPAQIAAATPAPTVSISTQAIGKYLAEFKQAQALVDAEKFEEAQTALALINEDLQSRIGTLKGGSTDRRELGDLAGQVQAAIRDLNFLIRDHDKKTIAQYRDAAKQEEQKTFADIVDYYLETVKSLSGQLNGIAQQINKQDLGQAQVLLTSLKADWLKAAGRLRGFLEVSKGSGEYRPARAAEFEKNIAELGVDISQYAQYVRMSQSFAKLSSGTALDQLRLERLRYIRAEALSLANDGEIRRETRDIYQKLVTDIDAVLAKSVPQAASSALLDNQYDPAILADIQARYSLIDWDDSFLDWEMFSTKKNADGQQMLSSLLNRPERPMVDRYRNLLREIQGIRNVVISGGFLTDDQIRYLRAAEAHFRLLDRIFTQEETRRNIFPTADLNQVLKALQVNDLKELLDVVESATLRSLINSLADMVPEGWRKVANLKVLWGGESIEKEMQRYKARLIELIWAAKDKDTGLLAKVEMPGAAGSVGELALQVSQQSARDLKLKGDLFKIGRQSKLLAHGIEDDKGGLGKFLSIILDGRIATINGMVNVGLLDSGDPSIFQGPHGPFYAVLSQQYAFEVGNEIGSRPPEHDYDFAYFLFPSVQERNFARDVVDAAVAQKASLENRTITPAIGETLKLKMLTYGEFIDRNKTVLAQADAASSQNTLISKIDLSSLEAEMKKVQDKSPQQVAEESKVRQDVMDIGDKMDFMAYGVSEAQSSDPFRTFVNIAFEGKLPGGEEGFGFGAMRENNPYGPRGQYIAVLNPDIYSSGGSAVRPQKNSDFSYFLFPNDDERGLALQMLWKAREQGIITDAQQIEIRFKLVTYREFIRKYQLELEIREAERQRSLELAKKVRAALLEIGVPSFSVLMIGDPVFKLTKEERSFVMDAGGEIAVILAKNHFHINVDQDNYLALEPFFQRFSGKYTLEEVGDLLDRVLAKISAGLNQEGISEKYEAQIARTFAAYYYKNYHLASKSKGEISPDIDLASHLPIGSGVFNNSRPIAILGAEMQGFVAMTEYPDQPVLLAAANPFFEKTFNEYRDLTGNNNVQIIGFDMFVQNMASKVTSRFDQIFLRDLFQTGRTEKERQAILQNAAAILNPGGALLIAEVFRTRDRDVALRNRAELEAELRAVGTTPRLGLIKYFNGFIVEGAATRASSAVGMPKAQTPNPYFKEISALSKQAAALLDQRSLYGTKAKFLFAKGLAHKIENPAEDFPSKVLLPAFLDSVFESAKSSGELQDTRIVFLEAGAGPLYTAAKVVAQAQSNFPEEQLKAVWATMGNDRAVQADAEQGLLFIKYLVDQGVLKNNAKNNLVVVDTDAGFDNLGTASIFARTVLDNDVLRRANERFGLNLQPFNEAGSGNSIQFKYLHSEYETPTGADILKRHIDKEKFSPEVGPKIRISGFNGDKNVFNSHEVSKLWRPIDLFGKTYAIEEKFAIDKDGHASIVRKPAYGQSIDGKPITDQRSLDLIRGIQDLGLSMGLLEVMAARGYDVKAQAEKILADFQSEFIKGGTASSALLTDALREEIAVRDQIVNAMIDRLGLDLNRYAGGSHGLYQFAKILSHRMNDPEDGLGDQVFLPRFIDDVFARAKEIGGASTAKIVFLEAGARPLYDAANLMARISKAYPVDSLKDVWATMGNYKEMQADPEQAVLFVKYLVDQGVISGQSGQPQKLLFVDTDTGFSDLGTTLVFTKTLLDPDVIKRANEKFGLSIQPFNESPDGNTLEIMYMFSDYNASPQKWALHISKDKIPPAIEQKLRITGYNSKNGTPLKNYISWTWNHLDLFVKTTSIFDRFSLNSRTGRVSVRKKEPYNQAYVDVDKLKVARALQDTGLLMGVLDVLQARGYDVTAEADKLITDLQAAYVRSGFSRSSTSASSGLTFSAANIHARMDRLSGIFKKYDNGKVLESIKGGISSFSFLARTAVHRALDSAEFADPVFLPKFIDDVFARAEKLGDPSETKIVFLEAGARPLYDAAKLTTQFTKQYPDGQLKSVWATMGNYRAMQQDPEQALLFIKYLVDEGVLTPDTKNLLIVDTDTGYEDPGTSLVFMKSLLDKDVVQKANERFGLNIAPFNEGGNRLEFLYMYSDYAVKPDKWLSQMITGNISPAMERKLKDAITSYNVDGQATLRNYIADIWSTMDGFVKTASIADRFTLNAQTGKVSVSYQAPYEQDSDDIRKLTLARAVEDTSLKLAFLDVLEARGYDVSAQADELINGLDEAYKNSGLVDSAASSPLTASSPAQPDINKVEARYGRVQSVIQKYDYGILDHIDTIAGLYARGASVVHSVDNPVPLFTDQVFLPKFLDAAFDKAKSFGDKAATKMVFLDAGAKPLYDAAKLMAQASGSFPVDNLKNIWATMGNYLAIRSDREQAILFIKYLVDQGVLTPETKHLLIVDTDTGQMSSNPRLQDSPIGTALIFAKTLLADDVVAEANKRYGFNIKPFNAGDGGDSLDILYMYSDYNATTTAEMKQQRWDDHVRVSQISPEVAARLHLEGFNQGVDDGITNYIGDLWFPVDNFTKTENIADRFSVDAATGKVVVTPAALYDQASEDVRELKLARAIEDTGLRIAMLDVLEARGYDVTAQEKAVLGDLEAAYKNSGLLEESVDAVASSPLTPGGIDLKADKLKLDIRGDRTPIKFNFDTQQLQNLQFDGLVPVIINISPVVNLPVFLSQNTNSSAENS